LELGYSANYFIRALEQLSAEIFDKSKQVNFVISIYRVLAIGEHSPWQYYNSKRIVILKDETATYDSELREVQLKQKHEIINFINTLILSIHLSSPADDKSERVKLLKRLDSINTSQHEEVEKINGKYGLKTEFFTIGNVVQQTIIRHLNFDATITRSKLKLIKMLINTADGIELSEIKAIRHSKLEDNNVLSKIRRNSELCLNLELF
jgi:hypothetical protein